MCLGGRCLERTAMCKLVGREEGCHSLSSVVLNVSGLRGSFRHRNHVTLYLGSSLLGARIQPQVQLSHGEWYHAT